MRFLFENLRFQTKQLIFAQKHKQTVHPILCISPEIQGGVRSLQLPEIHASCISGPAQVQDTRIQVGSS